MINKVIVVLLAISVLSIGAVSAYSLNMNNELSQRINSISEDINNFSDEVKNNITDLLFYLASLNVSIFQVSLSQITYYDTVSLLYHGGTEE